MTRSSDSLPLSVFIIAKNEADRIPLAIKSVRDWAHEVIVIDSGSEDDTMAVSESLGAKTVFNTWEGYGKQKQFGEGMCKQRWILNIDADEEVTPALREEITTLFAAGEPKHTAYHIPIRMVFRYDDAPRSGGPLNSPLRLYRTDSAGFDSALVHDSVIVRTGTAGHLQAPMHHRCFRSFTHMVHKLNYYSSMQAEDMHAKGRNPSALRIIAEPFAAFFKAYFLRRYIIFGIDGYIESLMYAFGRTLRLAKAREEWKQNIRTPNTEYQTPPSH